SLLFLIMTASDFFINQGFEYYPLGLLFILISLFIFTYAILAKHPKDIRLVLKKSSVFFASLFSLVIFISILKYVSLILYQRDSIWINYIFLVLAMMVYPYLRNYYYNLANKYCFTSVYNGRKLIAELSENLNSVLILKKMYKHIGDAIMKNIHPKSFYILIFDKNKKNYTLKYKKGTHLSSHCCFHSDKSSEKYLSQKCRVLSFDDFRLDFDLKSKNLIDALLDLKSEVFIPLSIKDKMIGIISLGEKESGDIYSEDDYEVLSLMAKQSAVSLENALNYEEIKDFNLKLEREVDLATKELRSANKKLKLLDQTKSEFISIASHQLRTPLTVIKGYISMLIDSNFGKLKEPQKQALSKVYDSNERLINLVENLLNISRIESGKLKFTIESNSIEKIVMSVMEELRAYAEGKGLVFSYHGPKERIPLLDIDAEKLRQSIMNLIDNAIKYTSKGFVKVNLINKLNKIIFCVEDSGLGIEPKELSILFKKFSRGTNTHLIDANGTGLGLFVAHKMIEAHKGKIWAESDGIDKGAKFYFELPIK
ncbi:MAG: GAF domain-containing sensor histidine kinase, partial [Sulfurimonas sp.]|nr:GAF domain-containing sensor histidine kinase [Sulfurimonas sp.]